MAIGGDVTYNCGNHVVNRQVSKMRNCTAIDSTLDFHRRVQSRVKEFV